MWSGCDDRSTSKTGKHGHAKVHLVAIDIFTAKKYEDISPSTHNMDVPNVSRNEYQLVNIDDGFLNLMTTDGSSSLASSRRLECVHSRPNAASKDDVKVPEGDLGEQIQADFDAGKDVSTSLL